MPQRKIWTVVGASRGLGYEMVKQLLSRDESVFATVRRDSDQARVAALWPEQSEDSTCRVFDCDMLSERSIDAFAASIAHQTARIDYLVLNAGILLYPNRATELSYNDFMLHLQTNTIGPVICAQRLLQSNVSIGTIVFISSDSGSAQCFREMEDGFAAYAASKAALNQMLRHMAAELRRKGSDTVVLALHPGEVATDMANVELGWDVGGQMTPAESIAACIPVIEAKGSEDTGTFWTWEGRAYPW